jgi:hypothetical protein
MPGQKPLEELGPAETGPSGSRGSLCLRIKIPDLFQAADRRTRRSDDDGAQLPELVVGPLLHDQGHRFPKRQGCDLARHREVARSLDGAVQGEEINHLV